MNSLLYSVVILTLTDSACGEAETASSEDASTILRSHCSQSSSLHTAYYARQGQQLQGLTGPGFVVQSGRVGCDAVDGLTTSTGNLAGSVGGRALASADFQGAALLVESATGVQGEVAITKVQA